ncbi:MAG: hypothetical protein CR971_02320 [candidate division SR1 bacterium]|nr:MAG: hypothetical protein CR971_02320 [candidate division SR1 bacterium]
MSFIVIEGVDGSGKATQTRLLKQKLTTEYHKTVGTISFPSYGTPGAYFVEQFLNGKYGNLDTIDEKLASMFYTLDRFDKKAEITDKIRENDFLISDRYSISSFIHRGVKYLEQQDIDGLEQFFSWLKEREFTRAGLPHPDKIIFLSLSLENQKYLLEQKAKETREYVDMQGGEALDMAESDLHHQELSLRVGKEILPQYFENYHSIDCDNPNGGILTPEEITAKILQEIL